MGSARAPRAVFRTSRNTPGQPSSPNACGRPVCRARRTARHAGRARSPDAHRSVSNRPVHFERWYESRANGEREAGAARIGGFQPPKGILLNTHHREIATELPSVRPAVENRRSLMPREPYTRDSIIPASIVHAPEGHAAWLHLSPFHSPPHTHMPSGSTAPFGMTTMPSRTYHSGFSVPSLQRTGGPSHSLPFPSGVMTTPFPTRAFLSTMA